MASAAALFKDGDVVEFGEEDAVWLLSAAGDVAKAVLLGAVVVDFGASKSTVWRAPRSSPSVDQRRILRSSL